VMCVMGWYMLLYVMLGFDVSKKVGSVCAPSIFSYPAVHCYLPPVPLLPSPLSSHLNLYSPRPPSHPLIPISYVLIHSVLPPSYSPLTFLTLFSYHHLLAIPLTSLSLSSPCFLFPLGWIFSRPNSELASKVTKPMLIMPAGTVLYCTVM
jgi:hypothetical protein